MFQGQPQKERHPSEVGMKTKDVNIITSDDHNLKGWLIRRNKSKRIIVFFPGNLGNLGMEMKYLQLLREGVVADILVVAYRGFSESDGTPSEEGIKTDTWAIFDYAVKYRAR